MTTQSVYFNHEQQPEQASGAAILFLMLGAPNLYSFFNKRTHRVTSEASYWSRAIAAGLFCFIAAATSVCIRQLS